MDRALLTLVVVVIILLAMGGLALGWRHRAARQERDLAMPELPIVPDDLGADLVEALAALYVSTTPHQRWQDRIVTRGLGRRAAATVRWAEAGILVDRVGEDAIFIPASSLVSVATGPGIAGKVMGLPNGILIITWRVGELLLDSGFRADDVDVQDRWIELARTRLANGASA